MPSLDAFIPLLLPIARSLKRRLPRAEVDDLIQWGFFGLASAAAKYDPAWGVPFNIYAAKRIRGAMLDAGRCRRRHPFRFTAVPLERLASREPAPGRAAETRDEVRRLLMAVPAQARRAVYLRCLEEMDCRAAGEEMGLCASRVSQLHAGAMEMMREAVHVH